VNNKVGPFAQSSTAAILKETFFSIIIDETTDISTSKCLVIVVRYYCRKQEKVVDVFFGLIELETATAEVIFKAILNLFQKYNISVSNIIGFASDNASVMMGNLNGVKARFQNIIPNIFVDVATAEAGPVVEPDLWTRRWSRVGADRRLELPPAPRASE
jgi:hypothetical protein